MLHLEVAQGAWDRGAAWDQPRGAWADGIVWALGSCCAPVTARSL